MYLSKEKPEVLFLS